MAPSAKSAGTSAEPASFVADARPGVSFFAAATTIFLKDLRSEFRTKEVFNAAAVFSLLVIVIFSMAFEPTSAMAREMSGGLLWLAYTFSGMLALSRTFSREVPNDCLLALRMAPIPPAAVYLGKLFSNLLFLGLLNLLLLPLFAVFYNVRLDDKLFTLVGIVLLGSWGLAAVGTTFAAISTSVRLREMMLPVLLFPIEIPLILSLVEATTAVLLNNDPLVTPGTWLEICLGFNIIFTVLSLMLFDHLLEE
ncbi:MAG: heme ABC transporter permease CcmB [Acidobacteria bacterium]|nr:heme ABC transporter permease CcmB [Acidobacteriota bacterium]